jgi:hypothetical protein
MGSSGPIDRVYAMGILISKRLSNWWDSQSASAILLSIQGTSGAVLKASTNPVDLRRSAQGQGDTSNEPPHLATVSHHQHYP